MSNRRRSERGTMALEMVILAPILLILFFFLQRWIVSGLAVGAVKG